MALSEQTLNSMLANPRAALDAMDKFECEQSLINFMAIGWHALEPGVEFVANWGVSAVCDHLEAVTRGEIKRLLINVPPGCTKSMSTNVYWPAWEWGPMGLPHYRYISFAHEQSLAIRDNVRCRSLINSEWYQQHWGKKELDFKGDQNAKTYYENNSTGFRQACAAASLTGRRGDRIIGDDPHSVHGADSEKKREEVLQIFSETVPTRLNKPAESAIVVIMQRVHERDVSGLILAKELGYEHLMLPMEFENSRRCYSTVKPSYIKSPKKEIVTFNFETKAWEPVTGNENEDAKIETRYNVDPRTDEDELLDPVRYTRDALNSLKEALRSFGGSYAEAGQLQQRPAPRGGGLFKKSDFQYLDSMRGYSGRIVRGWDFAASTGATAAYTAGVKMMLTNGGDVIIMDCNRFKKTPGAVEVEIKRTCDADGKHVVQDMPQDPGQAGKSQKVAFLKLLHGFKVKFSPESGSKEERAAPLAAQCEGGNVYLLRGEWNDAFVNEASMFPNGQFKDQVDAASRAYAAVNSKPKKKMGRAPKQIDQNS